MYAVISTGGKQYRVAPGETVQIEKITGTVGQPVELNQVLMVAPDEGEAIFGHPLVDGAKVVGKIVGDRKAKKIVIQKFKRRKRYRVRTGHRQQHHQVMINSILLP